MIVIPPDKYEERLSMHFREQIYKLMDKPEERIFSFLLRLANCQMRDRQRGENYPFIAELNLSFDELRVMR